MNSLNSLHLMNLRAAFFDPNGSLRSGCRFAVFAAAFVFLGGLFATSGASLLSSFPLEFRPGLAVYFIISSLLSLVPALIIGWLCGKFLEGVPFRALGASFSEGWLTNFLFGSAVGLATMGLAALIAAVFGGLSFQINSEAQPTEIAIGLVKALVVFAAAAAFEEVLFRGYIFQTFMRSGWGWFAIALTSALFTSVHIGNPNANLISAIDTAVAGVWFGVAYLRSRDLWFPFGMHLLWNWAQGAVFGIEVSGLKDIAPQPLLHEIDRGPTWLTGGDYGIEAGIASTCALLISAVVIYFSPYPKPSDEMLRLTSQPNFVEAVRERESA